MIIILDAKSLTIDIEDCQPAAPAKPQFYTGTANNWVDYPQSPQYTGVYVDVNISVLGLKSTPLIFTTLTG